MLAASVPGSDAAPTNSAEEEYVAPLEPMSTLPLENGAEDGREVEQAHGGDKPDNKGKKGTEADKGSEDVTSQGDRGATQQPDDATLEASGSPLSAPHDSSTHKR